MARMPLASAGAVESSRWTTAATTTTWKLRWQSDRTGPRMLDGPNTRWAMHQSLCPTAHL